MDKKEKNPPVGAALVVAVAVAVAVVAAAVEAAAEPKLNNDFDSSLFVVVALIKLKSGFGASVGAAGAGVGAAAADVALKKLNGFGASSTCFGGSGLLTGANENPLIDGVLGAGPGAGAGVGVAPNENFGATELNGVDVCAGVDTGAGDGAVVVVVGLKKLNDGAVVSVGLLNKSVAFLGSSATFCAVVVAGKALNGVNGAVAFFSASFSELSGIGANLISPNIDGVVAGTFEIVISLADEPLRPNGFVVLEVGVDESELERPFCLIAAKLIGVIGTEESVAADFGKNSFSNLIR